MNINNIIVSKYPISQVFDPDSKTRFEIPKYQREYVWGTNEWTDLYDDLFENGEGYFLGSIICINSATDSLSPKFEVVDGQQRLTTISMLLAALYDVLNTYKDKLDEDQQADLLQLRRKLVLKNKQDLRVIPQVPGGNQDDYLGLMAKIGLIPPRTMPAYAGTRRIVKCFIYFKKRIAADLEESEDAITTLFQILDKVNTAILVMIEVSSHSDAYTLFESLNNRGTPLTSVDLIKNLLLARLDITESENIDYYFARWREVLSNLGDDYAIQERFFRQNYNAFRKELNSPFRKDDERMYPLGIIATRSTLLNIYEKLVTRDPKEFLDTITENSAIYSHIILKKTEGLSSGIQECFRDLQRVQGAPAYLFLMYLFKNMGILNIDEDDILKTTRMLINFFIRRNVTDTPPTRDLTRLFMAFIEEIEQKQYQKEMIFNSLRNKLVSVSATDEFFAEKLHGSLYDENSGACRFILCMMAKAGMNEETYVDLWRQYDRKQYVWSIEHIFPQGSNIPQAWVNMIANGDYDKAQAYQRQYVHTLGNLTITGYNSTLGNKSFEEKRDRKDNKGNFIGYKNGLNLNENIAKEEEWTIDKITARTERMVQRILEMFQL